MSFGGHVRDSVCEGENIENGLFGSTQTNPYKTRVVFRSWAGFLAYFCSQVFRVRVDRHCRIYKEQKYGLKNLGFKLMQICLIS